MKRWIFAIAVIAVIIVIIAVNNGGYSDLDVTEPELDNSANDIEIIDDTNNAEPEPEREIEITIPDFEPPESLSLDIDKIVDYDIGLDKETYIYYAVNALQKKYPDLVLIDSDYKGKPEDRDNYIWFGKWQSEMSGMTYLMMHYPSTEGKAGNSIYKIYGKAYSIILGLTYPVKVNVCMELLGIPEEDWAIGKAPAAPRFEYYATLFFEDILPEDFCFVIPDYAQPEKFIYDAPMGVIITMSIPGYISPEDEFTLGWAGWGE